MKLENLNLVELNATEVREIEGGWDLKKVLSRSLWGAAAVYVMNNWPDIKSGISDGLKDGPL
jgi:hypothetical protein